MHPFWISLTKDDTKLIVLRPDMVLVVTDLPTGDVELIDLSGPVE